jgi:16S rRNA (guanine1207-N2)-methyltransferase
MARRKTADFDVTAVREALANKLRPPLGIVMGSPIEAADLVQALHTTDVTCYQMDLYQAQRLEMELGQFDLSAKVVTHPDLWDLQPDFQTLVYPVPQGGERGLKLDLIEQAYHVLRPHGMLLTLSPYEKDQLLPVALKKVFGRVHAPAVGGGSVFWCQRNGDRPRRRHEVTFQVSGGDGPSFRFLSRPGVFSHGRFDNGARALVETMEIREGDRVLDLGCGCGTNGIIAARRSGPMGHITFVDSNLRALALAEHNARLNGVPHFNLVGSSNVTGIEGDFEVVLANPPYYAQLSIAQLFIERGRELLRAGGRFYLVTKQPNQVGPLVAEAFGAVEALERRGYIVLEAVVQSGVQG